MGYEAFIADGSAGLWGGLWGRLVGRARGAGLRARHPSMAQASSLCQRRQNGGATDLRALKK